jgi:hypothetical protein
MATYAVSRLARLAVVGVLAYHVSQVGQTGRVDQGEPAAPPATPPATGRCDAASSDAALSANQRLGKKMAADRGWTCGQWRCLKVLWIRESAWRVYATNPTSGAYGIPQSLPATKMAAAGGDWRTSARTQIRWGLAYIDDRYGTPCRAWAHWRSVHWY